MASILYAVRDTSLLESHPPRLVEAQSRAQAIRFCASKYEAKPCSAKDVAELMSKDIVVEKANGESA